MSRLTCGNLFKLGLAFVFGIFVSFYVLVIGVTAKDKRVIGEGAIYAGMFSLAMVLTWAESLAAVLGLLSMGASAVRCYMLRDLWLPRRNRATQQFEPVPPRTYIQPAAQQGVPAHSYTQTPGPHSSAPAASAAVERDLSSDLAWVSSHAKHNKRRLPPESYVTVLETCQTLDSVIDAERRQPTADARFEYELTAMVREYLPSVLRGYLAIPPEMANDKQPNGRTPNEELFEQLELLSRQADALHASRHGHTSAELTTTGNFLRERFGHHRRGTFDFGIE